MRLGAARRGAVPALHRGAYPRSPSGQAGAVSGSVPDRSRRAIAVVADERRTAERSAARRRATRRRRPVARSAARELAPRSRDPRRGSRATTGCAACTGRCSRSPVISTRSSPASSTTLRWPGVCPGVCTTRRRARPRDRRDRGRACRGRRSAGAPRSGGVGLVRRAEERPGRPRAARTGRWGTVGPSARPRRRRRDRRAGARARRAAPRRGRRRRPRTRRRRSTPDPGLHGRYGGYAPTPRVDHGSPPAGPRTTNACTCQGHESSVEERPRMSRSFGSPVDVVARALVGERRAARCPGRRRRSRTDPTRRGSTWLMPGLRVGPRSAGSSTSRRVARSGSSAVHVALVDHGDAHRLQPGAKRSLAVVQQGVAQLACAAADPHHDGQRPERVARPAARPRRRAPPRPPAASRAGRRSTASGMSPPVTSAAITLDDAEPGDGPGERALPVGGVAREPHAGCPAAWPARRAVGGASRRPRRR